MKVIFLDRDGVINNYPGDLQYVKSVDEFAFLPNTKTALKRLQDSGFRLFIVSNQAGVAKGIYSQGALDLITRRMLDELEECGVHISGVHYCTHRSEDNCSCRKPKAGLVHAAIAKLREQGVRVDLSASFFIGDTVRDIQTGKAAGLKTVLVFSGKEKAGNRQEWHSLPDFTADDLSGAADLILASNQKV